MLWLYCISGQNYFNSSVSFQQAQRFSSFTMHYQLICHTKLQGKRIYRLVLKESLLGSLHDSPKGICPFLDAYAFVQQ